jgi:chemotaxis protein methyltransferase WspC
MTCLPEIETMLRAAIGLNPASIGPAAIGSAVRARMEALRTRGEAEYVQSLRQDPRELQELIEQVVVPETWFFRDAAPLSILARLASERQREALGSSIRILSVPCATGEEPYSIAMALMDQELAPEQIRIDAIDVSARALARARQGVYDRHSFRTSDLTFRERYFHPVGGAWAVSDMVRGAISFQQRNLLAVDFAAAAGAYDFIFCRNLLIYFDEAARDLALANLKRVLAPDGRLFVGAAEMGGIRERGFTAAGEAEAFALRHAESRSLVPAVASRSRSAISARAAVARPPRTAHAPAPIRRSAPLATVVAPASSAPIALDELDQASRFADLGRLKEAAELCRGHLAKHGDSARAHHLLGLIHDTAGEEIPAAAHYRKALYLEPDHYESLLHFGLLLERQGDVTGAERLQRRARRQALTAGKDER